MHFENSKHFLMKEPRMRIINILIYFYYYIYFAYICCVFHADTSNCEVRVVWGICLYKERRLLDVLSLAL